MILPTAQTNLVPATPDLIPNLRLLLVADSSSTHTHRWAHWFHDRGASVSVLSCSTDPIPPSGPPVGSASPSPSPGTPGEGRGEGSATCVCPTRKCASINVIPFPASPKWYHRLPKLRILLDYPPFQRIIRELDPQLIHIHFVSEGGRAFYWDRLSIPLIASSWGQDVIFDQPRHPSAEPSLRRVFSRCQFITATTHQLAAATARFTPPSKPIYIIPFGVDLTRFTPREPQPADHVTLGFVKHLLPKYGPDILIEAFSLIHRARPHTRLILAGRGFLRPALERRIVELGLTESIELIGRVPHENIPDLIRSLDIMVMPSIYDSETFGVAAIEAAACAVPVVASRVGGVPEAVLHNHTGLLVPPRDVEFLAEACLTLIDDPGRRQRLGLAGRQFVQRHYVWQNNARQMEEIYRAALCDDLPRTVPIYRPGAEPSFAVPTS